jgi:hypothetical protein
MLEDTSFARSRDPCTSIGTELRQLSVKAPSWSRCRGGRDIAVGQTWVTRRNRHRGHGHTDECAARRVSPLFGVTRAGRAWGVRKGRWSWPSSLRGNESPGVVSVRRVSLQKSASSILASNKLARSAPKRVAVRVNGGLAGVAQGTQVSGTMLVNRRWRSAFIAN